MSVDLHTVYQKMFHALGPQQWWPARTRFEVIVGAVLTQNTSWKNRTPQIRTMERQPGDNPRVAHQILVRSLSA